MTTANNTVPTHWVAFDVARGHAAGYGKTLNECEASAARWTDDPWEYDFYKATAAAYEHAVAGGGCASVEAFDLDVYHVTLKEGGAQ